MKDAKTIDTERFEELELGGYQLKNVITDETMTWNETMAIKPGITILTTKLSDEKK